MDNTTLVVGIIVGILQIVGVLAAGFKVYTNIMVTMARLDNRISNIEAQYVPNGGSSMRDAINRIELKFTKLEGKFEQHVDENDV